MRLRSEDAQHADRVERHFIGRADACKMVWLPAVGGILMAVPLARFLNNSCTFEGGKAGCEHGDQ